MPWGPVGSFKIHSYVLCWRFMSFYVALKQNCFCFNVKIILPPPKSLRKLNLSGDVPWLYCDFAYPLAPSPDSWGQICFNLLPMWSCLSISTNDSVGPTWAIAASHYKHIKLWGSEKYRTFSKSQCGKGWMQPGTSSSGSAHLLHKHHKTENNAFGHKFRTVIVLKWS